MDRQVNRLMNRLLTGQLTRSSAGAVRVLAHGACAASHLFRVVVADDLQLVLQLPLHQQVPVQLGLQFELHLRGSGG